jgi:orotate phosphoribosyltransferase-like protein
MPALLLEKDLNADQLVLARHLQKKGLTLSEIADRLRVQRDAVVQALYWDVVRKRP